MVCRKQCHTTRPPKRRPRAASSVTIFFSHERLAPAPDAYAWLFEAMGTLHRALAALDCPVPRPLVATYAPPGSLLRWLPATEAAVAGDPEAVEAARSLRDLVRRLRRRWVPASGLSQQLVHGDVRLSNVGRAPDGTTLYLDFGFLALRPRVHDLAHTLAFMVRALDGHHAPESLAWQTVPRLIAAYEAAARSRLATVEQQALVSATAAIPLHSATLAGFAGDPAGVLRAALPFLRLSAWLLARPTVGVAPAQLGMMSWKCPLPGVPRSIVLAK